MKKWEKALSCMLILTLCIPALATTAFGALYQSNNGGNYFKYTTFSEEEMTKYVPTVYEHGIMTGTSATTFDGAASYTIEQAVVTMTRYFNWTGYGVTE